MLRLPLVTFLVPDYDAGVAYFVGVLGFGLVEDTRVDDTKRWVVVEAPGGGARLLLAQASDDRQRSRVGDQTGGRVGFFLTTDDFAADHARLLAAGVRFTEQPRAEAYGRVVVFEDPFGNRWDLLESP